MVFMTSSNPSPLAGKIMLNLSWVALLALLTLFFANKESEYRNPNQSLSIESLGGYNQVTLERNRQHHYLATGSINGIEVTFLVDTGASDVAVPANLAERLRLIPGEKGLTNTANGRVYVHRTQIDQLTLGSIQMQDVPASINPGMDGDEILLGMSFLKQLEFSQKDGKLTLKQAQ